MIHPALILIGALTEFLIGPLAEAQSTPTVNPPPLSLATSTVTALDNSSPKGPVQLTTVTATSTNIQTFTNRRGSRSISPRQLAPVPSTQPTAIPPTQPTAVAPTQPTAIAPTQPTRAAPTQPTAIPPSQLSNPLPGSRTNTLPGSGPANNPAPAPKSGPQQ